MMPAKKTKMAASVLSFAQTAPWPERGSEDLTPEHREYLATRGLKQSYWKRANYRSEPDGLVIPYPTIEGGFLPNFGRKRLIPARGDQKFTQPAKQAPRLYFAPLMATKLDWSTVCSDASIEIYIIEGELHAAAVAQHGLPAIGIGGAWNWSEKLEDGTQVLIADFDLIEWRNRSVIITYDADVATNRHVQLAAVRLNRLLEARV
jgi:hypothetical protein